MKALLGHILLALIWVLISGDASFANFLLGLFFGIVVIWIAADLIGARGYVRRIFAAFLLAGAFAWEASISTLRVAHDVVTPRLRATPAVICVEIDASSDIELLMLTVFVTLTPGTIVVHIPDDRRRMYVYGMYVDDAETFRRRLKSVFERQILAVTRGSS